MTRRAAEDENDTPATNPVVARALKFFKLVSNMEKEQRQKEVADLEFEAGQHWDPKIEADRKAADLPVITIDLLSGPLNQVEGQAQESRAGITIAANKPGTAPAAAGLLQGFARNVEQQSGALDVYQHAVRRVSRAGRAGWRILPEYESDDSFDQVLRIKWFDNWHCVYLGPAKEQDGSDRMQAIIVDDLTHDEYLARFGESDLDTLSDSLGAAFQSTGDTPPGWLTSEKVRVAEYMEVKVKSRTLLQLEMTDPSGAVQRKTAYADELPKGAQVRVKGKFKAGGPVIPDGWTKVNERPVKEKSCCWYFINAKDVLEEKIWPIPFIPIIEIEGERRNIDGKLDRRGLVRMGKQLNQLADFHETSLVEQVDMGRTAPWLYEWSQVADFAEIWKNPKRQVGLPYRAVSDDKGNPIPPPRRETDEPPIQATVLAAQRAEQLLRNVTGTPDIFANETQASQNNQSGKAVLARQRQQDIGNSKYLVSRNRGIAFTGKIILAWAPAIYDTPRHHRVKDDKDKDRAIVTHNGQPQHAARLAQQYQVKPEDIVDLQHAAKYDVAVMAGKPYATQRMETVDIITSAVQAFPPIAPKALPILFKNADGPGMQELAAALEPDPQQQGVPIEEAQKAQMMIDHLAKTVHALQDQIDQKRDELSSKERIATSEQQTRKEIAAAQEETKRLIAQLQMDRADALTVLEVMRATHEAARDHAHEVGMEGMRAVHAAGAAREAAVHQGMAADQQHGQNLEAQEQAAALAPEPSNNGASA